MSDAELRDPEVHVQTVAEVLAGDVEIGTRVYRVPPGELVVAANARTEVPDDPDFAASIREHGVLQPITAYVRDGQLVVEMGQRRAVVAARVGWWWVPVVLTAPPDEVRRLVEQVTENEHRAPLTTADRARAVQQLSLLGLTAGQLVHQTRLRRVDVDHALAVAASPVATAAAAAHPLSLEQAAVIAELGEDRPEVAEALTAAAERGGFDHVAERERERRRDAEAKQRVLDELRGSGVRIIDALDPDTRSLETLGLDPAGHTGCPGHAAWVNLAGRSVDGRWEYTWGAAYVCLEAARHVDLGPRQQTSLAEEQARADRAVVIERNRAWRTATVVRRRWLAEFARGRIAPEGAERWIAATLLRGDVPGVASSAISYAGGSALQHALNDQHRLLRDLLLRPDDEPARAGEPQSSAGRRLDLSEVHERIDRGSPRAALRLTCALLLAAWEARADVHVWRHPTDHDRWYLGQMHAWGYPLSDVEQLVVQPDRADQEPT